MLTHQKTTTIILNKTTPIHLIGIGGVGMSALAKVLLKQGYKVSGSDMAENAYSKACADLGATVYIGHNANNLQENALVVCSTAIDTQNPEIQPIFVSTKTAENDPRQVAIITNGTPLSSPLLGGIEGGETSGFIKVLDIFDGNNEEELAAARARWKEYKNQNYDLKYWSQDDAGKWVQKS